MCASIAASAAPPVAAQGPGDLAMEAVRTGLFLVSGGGSNSLVRLSTNGMIVVDGKLPGYYDALLRQAQRLSDLPVRVLILTHYEQSCTGNDTRFIDAGTEVLANQNVKQNLANYRPDGNAIAPPTLTYDREYTITLGGIEARVLHLGNAHTNGDSIVYFPNLKVVAVGDLVGAQPNPDFSRGGSLIGWGPVLGELLKLDFDIAVASTGPQLKRADVEAFKTKIETVVSRATALARSGVSRDQLMSQLRTDDLGWHFDFTKEQVKGFFEEVIRSAHDLPGTDRQTRGAQYP